MSVEHAVSPSGAAASLSGKPLLVQARARAPVGAGAVVTLASISWDHNLIAIAAPLWHTAADLRWFLQSLRDLRRRAIHHVHGLVSMPTIIVHVVAVLRAPPIHERL